MCKIGSAKESSSGAERIASRQRNKLRKQQPKRQAVKSKKMYSQSKQRDLREVARFSTFSAMLKS